MLNLVGYVEYYIYLYWLEIYLISIVAAVMLGLLRLTPLTVKSGEEDRRDIWKAFTRRICLGVFMLIGSVCFVSWRFETELPIGKMEVFTWIAAFCFGLAAAALKIRYLNPLISGLIERTRIGQSGDAASDIRLEVGRHSPKQFDPRKYYKDGHFFYGLNEAGEAVYLTVDEWRTNHQASIGPVQTGKGVSIGVQVDQAIKQNHCVIFIDPKPDKFVRSIMIEASKSAGRRFVEIDLNGEMDTEYYSPFASGSHRQKRDRLINACNLVSTGGDGDYYVQRERDALEAVIAKTGFDDFDLLVKGVIESHSDNGELSRTVAALQEIQRLGCLKDTGPNAISIEREIVENSIVYIRSSITDNTVQTASKMLIQDIGQTLFRTSPESGGDRDHHVFIVVDELRFLISNYLVDALATIKGFNAHLLVAYQTMKDIRNVRDKNLDKDAVETSVNVNCTNKLYYRAGDFETADTLAKSSGTINKQIEDRKTVTRNEWGGDELSGDKFLSNVEEQYITANDSMLLPERVGILMTPTRLAEVIYTAWVATDPMNHIPVMRKGHDTPPPTKEKPLTKKKVQTTRPMSMNEKLSMQLSDAAEPINTKKKRT